MKNIKLLLFSLLILIMPVLVLADAGGPSFTEYNVRVTNKNGTDLLYYDSKTNDMASTNKHFNFDDIISGIVFEENINNERYGYSQTEGYFVKLKDVQAYGEVDFEFLKERGFEPGKLYVYKSGAYLYKGPSKTYGKVDGEVELPVGTTIQYTYRDELFAYVEYNGVSGWVYIYQPADNSEGSGPYKEGSSLANIESGKLITLDETPIYKDTIGEDTIGSIPKNVNLSYKYSYYKSNFLKMYYVKYNGISGWVKDVGIYQKNKTIFSHLKEVTICKDRVYEECTNPLGTIPKNTMVNVKYSFNSFDRWYYVEYNGISGWVYDDNYDLDVYYSTKIKYLLKKDAYFYTDIYGDKTDKVLEPQEIIVDYVIWDNNDYESNICWLYINDGNNKGWIKSSNDDIEYLDYIEEDNNINDDTDSEIPFNILIIYLLGGIVVLSLTTFIVIKLINKKND